MLVSSDHPANQDSHDDKGQLENCSNPVLPWCQTAKRLLFLPSKVVEYVRRLHISNHPAILNSQQPYSLPAPHHNLSTPCFFQTKTVVTDERMGILQCWICWVCIVWSVEPAARCIVYCDNLAETKKRKTVRTSYVKLLNWCLLYLTRPRNNVYIAILYLYKSYF